MESVSDDFCLDVAHFQNAPKKRNNPKSKIQNPKLIGGRKNFS